MTAAAVFGENFTPDQRGLAKNGNFSIVFGASPGTLVRKYGFPSEKVARDILEGFYKTYKRVNPWRDELISGARHRYKAKKSPPYTLTILGRKRRLPELLSSLKSVRYGAERQAVSSVIQGSAADLFKLGMIQAHNRLQEAPWEGHLLMMVHDELVAEVPEEYAEDGLDLIKSSMEDVVNPMTGEPLLSVPVVADAKIVERWSDAK